MLRPIQNFRCWFCWTYFNPEIYASFINIQYYQYNIFFDTFHKSYKLLNLYDKFIIEHSSSISLWTNWFYRIYSFTFFFISFVKASVFYLFVWIQETIIHKHSLSGNSNEIEKLIIHGRVVSENCNFLLLINILYIKFIILNVECPTLK